MQLCCYSATENTQTRKATALTARGLVGQGVESIVSCTAKSIASTCAAAPRDSGAAEAASAVPEIFSTRVRYDIKNRPRAPDVVGCPNRARRWAELWAIMAVAVRRKPTPELRGAAPDATGYLLLKLSKGDTRPRPAAGGARGHGRPVLRAGGARALGGRVRKTLSWPRSWANFSLL
jgi:hypothetical protein